MAKGAIGGKENQGEERDRDSDGAIRMIKQAFIECLLYAMHCSKYVTNINSFIHLNPRDSLCYHHAHFTIEERDAGRKHH